MLPENYGSILLTAFPMIIFFTDHSKQKISNCPQNKYVNQKQDFTMADVQSRQNNKIYISSLPRLDVPDCKVRVFKTCNKKPDIFMVTIVNYKGVLPCLDLVNFKCYMFQNIISFNLGASQAQHDSTAAC